MQAALSGVVRRPLPTEKGDVVIVARSGERIPTYLDFEHTVTESGPALILDGEGKPFVDDGEVVRLAGGTSKAPAWPGEQMFVAGKVEHYLPPGTPLTAPLWAEVFGHVFRDPGLPQK